MYRFHNANARNNFVNDCTVRSISVAENKSWDTTFNELSTIAQANGTMIDDVDFIEEYLDRRYKRQCHYSKTVGEFIEEYPKGIYLVTMPRTHHSNKKWSII